MSDTNAVQKYIDIITEQLEALQTYRPQFETVIRLTAELLAERDKVYEQYEAEGQQPVITKTSDRGAQNTTENPLLRTWRDLTENCRKNLSELGLSPRSLKALTEQKAAPPKQESSLMKIIKQFDERYEE